MKATDKMRMIAVLMWFTGGLITFSSNPAVSILTMLSAFLFGGALLIDLKEKS